MMKDIKDIFERNNIKEITCSAQDVIKYIKTKDFDLNILKNEIKILKNFFLEREQSIINKHSDKIRKQIIIREHIINKICHEKKREPDIEDIEYLGIKIVQVDELLCHPFGLWLFGCPITNKRFLKLVTDEMFYVIEKIDNSKSEIISLKSKINKHKKDSNTITEFKNEQYFLSIKEHENLIENLKIRFDKLNKIKDKTKNLLEKEYKL